MIEDDREELTDIQIIDNFYETFNSLVLSATDTETIDRLKILSQSFNELIYKYEILFKK